jgi:hypothetical protein
MKKINLLILTIVFASLSFIGCKKEKKEDVVKINDVAPTSYQQKVVLEYFSGAWCQFCPDGIVVADRVKSAVGSDRFINYVIHSNDKMSFEKGNQIINKFKPAYPQGMVNRTDGKAAGRNTWEATANNVKGMTANCGLKIDATQKDGDKYKVKVTLGIGANALSGDYLLSVVAVAKELTGTGTGWDQVNYYNTQTGHPYAGKGNPIKGYVHKSVAFDILSSATGDQIPNDNIAAGKLSSYEFTLDLKGQPASNMEVVAIISNGQSSFILNGSKVEVGAKNEFE